MDAPKNAEKQNSSQNTPASFISNNQVHRPRCPYCNSENLTKITSFDRAVNAASYKRKELFSFMLFSEKGTNTQGIVPTFA